MKKTFFIAFFILFLLSPTKTRADGCAKQDQPCKNDDECTKDDPQNCSGYKCIFRQMDEFGSGEYQCQGQGRYTNPTPPTQPPPPPPPCAEGKLVDGKCKAVATGLGIDIETEPAAFIKRLFGILLGLSGGIAVLLIIVSGYRLMASQGNPEKLQGAKEMLTSAIVGLLFIIFSFVILQVIGVDILRIPGFNP